MIKNKASGEIILPEAFVFKERVAELVTRATATAAIITATAETATTATAIFAGLGFVNV